MDRKLIQQNGVFSPCRFDEPIIIEPKPVEPIIIEPTPVEPIIIEPTPVEPIIIEPIPVEPIIIEPTPVEPIIIDPTPVEPIIIEPTPVEPFEDDPTPYYLDKKPDLSKFKNSSFVDKDFPPNLRIINSLDENNQKITPHYNHSNDYLELQYTSFKRPHEIFGDEYYLFQDSIEVGDSIQGDIGDCYLISSLACFAKYPEVIQKIFKTKSTNKQGFYEIYFFYEGKKNIIYVDDHLVYDEYYKRPRFANPNGNEIWVTLIEKALAKFEGGYSNIVGGNAIWLFELFTGRKPEFLSDKYTWWNKMCLETRKYSFVYAGSARGTGNDKDCSPNKIHYGDAYSVLEAKEYNKDNVSLKLVQVRNPWKSGEWIGDYSDDSPLWTPELIKYFNADEVFKDDGRFWMKFEDFQKEFDKVIILNIDELWQ